MAAEIPQTPKRQRNIDLKPFEGDKDAHSQPPPCALSVMSKQHDPTACEETHVYAP